MKNISSVPFLLVILFSLSGCVGVGTLKGQLHEWDAREPGDHGLCPVSYDKMIVGCPVHHVQGPLAYGKPTEIANVEDVTPDRLVAIWGTPDGDIKTNDTRQISYDHGLAWRGALVFVIIPIPLVVPAGENPARFTFENDHLVHVEYVDNRLDAAICGVHSEGPDGFGCVSDWH